MDHLEGANYRDYSAVPKRRRRSEISNGGTGTETAGEKPEEGTAQNSELMAETLRKLYTDKPEEKAETVTETAEDASGEAAEAAGEQEKPAAEDAADDAGGSRRRRSRKTE